MDAALSPLRQMGIRILNYPPHDWLIRAQSEWWNYFHHRTLILSHLERLGLRVNFAISALSPQPRISFLGTVLGLSSHESGDSARRALAIQKLAAHLQERHRSPTQSVSENAGPYGRSIASVTAGPAPHAPLQRWLKPRVPHNALASRTLAYQGESGLCNSPDPLEEPTVDGEGRGHGLVHTRKVVTTDASNTGWGGAVRRQTDLRPLVEDGERLPHQLLGNASSCRACQFFPAGPNRTPCADSLRQHVRGVLYKSPGRCLLEAPLILAERLLEWAQLNLRSLRAAHLPGRLNQGADMLSSEQCPLRGVDAPSAGGSEDLEDLWQGRSRTFSPPKTTLHCPTYYSKDRDALAHDWPNLLLYAFPPDRPASTGRQAYQGTGSQGAIGGPLVEEPTLVVRADSATDSSPLARSPETGSPLSGERNNMAPSTRAVGSLHLAAQWEPTGFPERVLTTPFPEARAPSTRRLYALSGLFSPLGASTVVKTPLPLS